MVARFKPKVIFLMGLQNKRIHLLQVKRYPLAPSSLPGAFSHFSLINTFILFKKKTKEATHSFACVLGWQRERHGIPGLLLYLRTGEVRCALPH